MSWAVIRLYPRRPRSIAKVWLFRTRKQAERFAAVRGERYKKSFYYAVHMYTPSD